MKNIWVLSIKTSLPNICGSLSDIKTESYAFEMFKDAKESLHAKLKELAFSKNAMFDGDGNMIHLKHYCTDEAWEPKEFESVYEDSLTKTVLLKIYDAVKSIFEGKNSDVSKFIDRYTDHIIAVEFQNDTMTMYRDDAGLFITYDPKFATNMFDTSEEKDYFLYVDDRFGNEDATSKLYIDLKKVEVQ